MSSDLIWWAAVQLGMWARRIVVVPPVSQNLAGMRQGREKRFVETFISQPSVEAFDKFVLLRLPRGNMTPFDLHLIGPFQDGMGCELRSVAHQEAPASVMSI